MNGFDKFRGIATRILAATGVGRMEKRRWSNRILRAAVVLPGVLLAAALAGCGASAVTGDGTTTVTVTIGEGGSPAAPSAATPRAAPRPRGAAIPSTVAAVRFTVSGAGIDNLVETVPSVPGSTLTVTLQVPSGPARSILVEALDSGGVSRFRGEAVIDAAGAPVSITIGMAVDPSNPALQTWAAVADTVSTSASLNRVVQGDGIVVAGGTSGEILSSADGVSWTSRTSRNISGDISTMAFGGGTFLAMTSTGNFTAFPATWTNRFFGATIDNVDDWTARGIVGTVGLPVADLAFGGGVFVAVAGDNAFRSPDDGATWSPAAISGVSLLSGVAYGNGRFVATDAASDNVAVSTDGALWTTAAVGLPSPETVERIGFGGGTFLLTTTSGDAYTSPDGASWRRRTRFAELAGSDTSVARVAYGAGVFLIVTGSPTQIIFSVDSGDAWTAVDPVGGGGGFSLEDATFWNGAFIGVGGDFVSPALGHAFRSGEL